MNGSDIWIFRLSHNMRQKELANILGVSKSLISYMENGGTVGKRTKNQMELLIKYMRLRDEYINIGDN